MCPLHNLLMVCEEPVIYVGPTHPPQEGCDEDMATLDMITNIAYAYLFEVISDKRYAICNLCYAEQKYFTSFCFMPNCRTTGHLYNPHMKDKGKIGI